MCMEVCLCMGVCVSLGDGGNVGSQGRTEEAAMAWGRSRWSSVPFPLGNNRNEYERNRITKITR